MIFTILFTVFHAVAQTNFTSVQFSQFEKGNHWTWTYSAVDLNTGAWTPYLRERYTVTDVQGKRITIEMRSSADPSPTTEAHHKMVVDFAKCEQATKNVALKNFTIAFYTKSYGPEWQLVSTTHKNLPFTEKFNCSGPLPSEKVYDTNLNLDGTSYAVFQFQKPEVDEASWYFLDRPDLQGVAAYKLFLPHSEYKSELADFCNQGAACL